MTKFIDCYLLLDRKARMDLWFLFGLTVVSAAFETLSVALLLPYIGFAAAPDRVLSNPMVSTIFTTLGFTDQRSFIQAAGIAILLLFVAKAVFSATFARHQLSVINSNAHRLSLGLFAHYLSRPYVFHLGSNSTDLMVRARDIPQMLFNNFVLSCVSVVSEVVVVAALLSLLLTIEPTAALLGGAGGALLIAGYQRLSGARMARQGRRRHDLAVETYCTLQQAMNGIKEVKVMGREPNFWTLFANKNLPYVTAQRDYQFLAQLPRTVNEFALALGVLLAVTVMINRTGSDAAEVLSHFAILVATAFRVMPSVNRISGALATIRGFSYSVELLRDEVTRNGSGIWKAALHNDGDRPPPLPFTGALTFDDVSYTYPEAEKPSISHLNLTITAGQIVGFVGPSGAGKSTLADLVLGLLAPQGGRITVDGVDIATDSRRWQDNLGYVPQRIYLINDSVRANVAFGLPPESIDDDRVWHALEAAQLAGLVRQLPDGLDTNLGENGTRLSGGQCQRVGIARALYYDPSVLVFDEATSALDVETENEISSAIRSLAGRKTIILIAHRLETVRNSDRVFLLRHGELVASGSLDELAQADPAFRRMMERDRFRAPSVEEQS